MRVGSMFSGYGGLDLAVGGDLAWYCEVDAAACAVMQAHYPDVPNLGDVTQIDWSQIEPVDVITAGYPCQPFSQIGRKRGADDERHLWPHVRDAISAIRPRRAVLENVRGHLTLGFDVVLTDLARMGLSAAWGIVRASDAGAPHYRARLFVHVSDPDSVGRSERRKLDRRASEVDEQTTQQRPAGSGRLPGAEWVTGAWEPYAQTFARWAQVVGRPAPEPTTFRLGRRRLDPVFIEWMMGLPAGWVTDQPISPAQQMRMLGNGVVPQQARLALEMLGAA